MMITSAEKFQIKQNNKSKDFYEVKRSVAPCTFDKDKKKIQIELDGESMKMRFVRNERLRERFLKLSQIWHEEMDGVSSIQVKTNHWAYEEVISLGRAVVPYILEELIEHQGGGWFVALGRIMQYNPVPDDHKSDIRKIIDDWTTYVRQLRLDF